jgi:hypothetical protein
MWCEDLSTELDKDVSARWQVTVATVQGWRDKYKTPVDSLRHEQGAANKRFDDFMNQLGYV